MLHCASVAAVDRPLALVAGELAVAAVGTGVAQIHGCVCKPSRIGPPRTWLVSVRVTFFIGTVLGTCTSTSASPSLSKSARLDRVRITKLKGGGSVLIGATL